MYTIKIKRKGLDEKVVNLIKEAYPKLFDEKLDLENEEDLLDLIEAFDLWGFTALESVDGQECFITFYETDVEEQSELYIERRITYRCIVDFTNKEFFVISKTIVSGLDGDAVG